MAGEGVTILFNGIFIADDGYVPMDRIAVVHITGLIVSLCSDLAYILWVVLWFFR